MCEEIDDGSIELRSGQATSKFLGAAAKSQLSNEEVENAVLDSSGDEDEADDSKGEDAAGSNSESGSDEDGDDGLGWVTSCLLDEDMSDTKKASKAQKPVTPRKSARTQSAPSPGASCRARGSSGKSGSAVVDSASAEAESMRRKFRGKGVDEILDKVGWKVVKDNIDAVHAALLEPPFTTMILGGSLEKYVQSAAELRKKAVAAQSKLVFLDIKVKKWIATPQSVLDVLASQRRRSKALVDCLIAFPGIQKQHNPSKMEQATCCLNEEGIPTPMAFHFLFFKEKACELIRFHHMDEYVAHIQDGADGYIQPEMFDDTTGITDLRVDTQADALKYLMQTCTVENNSADGYENIGELAFKILQISHGLPEDAVADCKLVAQAFGGGSTGSVDDRDKALNRLQEMKEDTRHTILMPMLREPKAGALLSCLGDIYRSGVPLQDSGCAQTCKF